MIRGFRQNECKEGSVSMGTDPFLRSISLRHIRRNILYQIGRNACTILTEIICVRQLYPL